MRSIIKDTSHNSEIR